MDMYRKLMIATTKAIKHKGSRVSKVSKVKVSKIKDYIMASKNHKDRKSPQDHKVNKAKDNKVKVSKVSKDLKGHKNFKDHKDHKDHKDSKTKDKSPKGHKVSKDKVPAVFSTALLKALVKSCLPKQASRSIQQTA
jgi:hypothetical protein